MLLFFQVFVWALFALLLIYVVCSWAYREAVTKRIEVIRKTWYVLFLLGALVYWTYNPTSIFTHWSNYIISAAVIVLVDMFVFLSMYISKVGDHELTAATIAVAENSKMLTDNREKIKNMFSLLKKEGIPAYYSTDREYLDYLELLLQAYVEKEGMTVNIMPFKTEQEKQEALSRFSALNPSLIRATLEREDTYYNDEEHMALYPVNILNEPYVIKIYAVSFVSEVDCLLIALLIMMFDMVIKQQ